MSDNIINEVIKSLESAVSTLTTEIANIEETYRKKLEEAKAALNEQLEETKAQLNYWFIVRGDLPPQEKKTRTRRAKKSVTDDVPPVDGSQKEVPEDKEVPQDTMPESEAAPVAEENMEKVIDTLFPENNEEESQEPNEEVSAEAEQAEGSSQIEQDMNEVWPENDGFEEKDADKGMSDEFPEEWN